MEYQRCVVVSTVFMVMFTGLASSQFVITQPQNVSVREGETGQIACKFDISATACVWHKGTEQISIGERYHFLGTLEDGDCSIQIDSSKIGFDDGMWVCGLPATSDQHAVYSDKAKYTVYASPNAPVIYKDGQALVNGSVLTRVDNQPSPQISCSSSGGNPAPTITLTKAGGSQVYSSYTVQPSADNLTFTVVATMLDQLDTSFDGQLLTCIVTHPALNTSLYTFVAVRKQSPVTKASAASAALGTSGSTTIMAESGSLVSLKCTTDGAPEPKISWDKRSSDSASWSNFRAYTSAVINFTAEAGQFSCQAWNDGTGSTKIRSNTVILNVGTSSGIKSAENGFVIMASLLLGLFWALQHKTLQS